MGDTAEQKARVTDKPEVVPVRLWQVGGSNWSLPLIAGGSRRIRRRFLPAALAERGVRCEGRGIRGEGRGIRDEVRGMRDEGRGVRCERIFPRGAKGLTPGGLGYICTRGRAEWPTRGQKADPSTDLPGSTRRRPGSPFLSASDGAAGFGMTARGLNELRCDPIMRERKRRRAKMCRQGCARRTLGLPLPWNG